MTGDCRARFCGSPEVRSLRATRPRRPPDEGHDPTNNHSDADSFRSRYLVQFVEMAREIAGAVVLMRHFDNPEGSSLGCCGSRSSPVRDDDHRACDEPESRRERGRGGNEISNPRARQGDLGDAERRGQTHADADGATAIAEVASRSKIPDPGGPSGSRTTSAATGNTNTR